MIQESFVIRNKYGLHLRPAVEFVKAANRFTSKVKLCRDKHEVDGRSVLEISTLGASNGTKITLMVSGGDEKRAFEALKSILLGEDG